METAEPAAGPVSVSKADALLELARQLSTELHPGRRPRRIELSSTLDVEFGFDSLARVELFLRVERSLGAALPEQLLISAVTLADLLPELERASAAVQPQCQAARGPPPSAVAVIETPDTARTLLDAGGEPAPLSYAALLQSARDIAVGLGRRDLQPGDAVGLMLPTCMAYFQSFFGVLVAGLVPVPLYLLRLVQSGALARLRYAARFLGSITRRRNRALTGWVDGSSR